MHDETDRPDASRPRRWTPNLRAGRNGSAHQARPTRATTTIVISVACPTPECAGRLQFGGSGDEGGLITECPTCRQPFRLTAGDVELRRAHDTPREDAG
jgi:hypothetical protein